MALESVTRCTICKQPTCDGQEYVTPDMWGSYGFHIGVKRVCKKTEGVFTDRAGILKYRVVSGHGDVQDYLLTPG